MAGKSRVIAVAAAVGAASLLLGCRFQVKDIGGLQAYMSDAECVRLRASEMKDCFPDPESADYLRVRALYTDAMAQANAFVAAVRGDAAVRNGVLDVPESRYEENQASAKLLGFMEETGKLRAEHFSRLSRELNEKLRGLVADALNRAQADEKDAADRMGSLRGLEARLAALQSARADIEKAAEELKATGQKQGTIVSDEYKGRVVSEDYIPKAEEAVESAKTLGGKALDLAGELQQNLKERDAESQKQAKLRTEASQAMLQVTAEIAGNLAEPVPDSSALIMRGTRAAIPVIEAILALDGDEKQDGMARFDAMMQRNMLPDFDKIPPTSAEAQRK